MGQAVLRSPIITWALRAMLAWVAVHEIATWLPGDVDSHVAFSWYAYYAVYLSAVALVALRARAETGVARLGWGLLALGVASWLAGSLDYNLAPRGSDVTSPLLYLLYYPLMAAGLVWLIRSAQGRPRRRHLLDGAVAGTLCAAVMTGASLTPLARAGVSLDTTGFVDRTYPVLDGVLLGVCVCAWALRGWRADRTWTILTLGLVSVAAADTGYLLQTVLGDPAATSAFDPLWPLGTTLFALAATTVTTPPARDTDEGAMKAHAPVVLLGALVTMLVVAALTDASVVALVLLAAAGALMTLRVMYTLQENARLVSTSRRDALTDPLTGLGNRRALIDDLTAATETSAPSTLVLIDLDEFKAVNDQFGHLAGDALLGRVARRLEGAVAADGRAYRMGGDEFCVLVAGHWPEDRIRAMTATLAEAHGGVVVTGSHGAVRMPGEAADPESALRMADDRMYGAKPHVRREDSPRQRT